MENPGEVVFPITPNPHAATVHLEFGRWKSSAGCSVLPLRVI